MEGYEKASTRHTSHVRDAKNPRTALLNHTSLVGEERSGTRGRSRGRGTIGEESIVVRTRVWRHLLFAHKWSAFADDSPSQGADG